MQKIHYSSKLILVSGFAIVVLVITALTITWAIHVFESKENIKVIFGEQKQSRLLVAMRDAARQRAISLHRMISLTDPFDRDEEFMKFNVAATAFVVARDELLSMEVVASEEMSIWNKARPFIVNGQASQMETINLILQDRPDEANKLLLEKVIPTQNKVSSTLSAMFGVQKDTSLQAYVAAIDRNENIYWIAILSGISAVLVTVVIAFVVVRRTVYAESSLDEARVAAQTATRMKSQFLANMSHEIRTPLTAVIGYADTLTGQGMSEKDRAHTATRILINGKHLLEIINDVLDMSKIEAGQLSVEELAISQIKLLMNIDSLIGGVIRDKSLEFNISYEFPIPEQIKTDPTRLRQILLNLLGNAKKFTDEGGIVLKVRYLKDKKQMCYEVSDTGAGMTELEQSQLFGAFAQGDASTTRKFGGTGLGLYISRQLAQMLGGDLICRSIKGKGSQFIVTIDANIGQNIRFINSLDESSSLHSVLKDDAIPSVTGSVLLAEDNPDNQELISMYIKNVGADVVVVSNGQAAVEQAVAKTFDLILMDMQMPVMDGAEAVQLLRNVGSQTPIAMLTANAMREDKDRCLSLGANEFLTKPIDKYSFYAVLEKYLKESNVQRKINSEEDAKIMSELSEKFILSLPKQASDIQQALDKQDWDSIESIVHQLRGMGTSFGFPQLTSFSENIEENLRANLAAKPVDALVELIDYVDHIVSNQSSTVGKRKLGA
jgi:signal transduction histidine kinase/CheY-like chemotaxis protein/HPt (histidine-containing phosphotransfer) domain-containing protein